MKLWLDDVRAPPDDSWVWLRSADAAISVMKDHRIDELSLDHDLGHCVACEGCKGYKSPCGCRCHLTGYFVVCWMETENRWPAKKPAVHSMNPVGAAKMRAVIDDIYDGAAR